MTVSPEFAYRVQVKKHNGWQSFKTARFGISVGKPYHEGLKLRAAFEWAQKRFEHIEVRVSDTLQRHNMEGTEDERYTAALKAGDAWLARNHDTLAAFPNLIIYRWDSLLKDPEYPYYKAEISHQLECLSAFRAAFEEDVRGYMSRRDGDDSRCRSFLVEEFAAFAMLHDRRPAADIYPGSASSTPLVLRPGYNMTRIDFKRVPRQDLAA
jgi:tRNA-dependent cyclodipeptide synthase